MKNTASVEQYIANKPLVVEYVVFCAFCMLDLCSYSCLCPRALANSNQHIQIWEKMLEFFLNSVIWWLLSPYHKAASHRCGQLLQMSCHVLWSVCYVKSMKSAISP